MRWTEKTEKMLSDIFISDVIEQPGFFACTLINELDQKSFVSLEWRNEGKVTDANFFRSPYYEIEPSYRTGQSLDESVYQCASDLIGKSDTGITLNNVRMFIRKFTDLSYNIREIEEVLSEENDDLSLLFRYSDKIDRIIKSVSSDLVLVDDNTKDVMVDVWMCAINNRLINLGINSESKSPLLAFVS